MNYANITSLMKVKNKPKLSQFKPIQTQLLQREKMMQSVHIQRIKKKNEDMGYEKQSQNKAN